MCFTLAMHSQSCVPVLFPSLFLWNLYYVLRVITLIYILGGVHYRCLYLTNAEKKMFALLCECIKLGQKKFFHQELRTILSILVFDQNLIILKKVKSKNEKGAGCPLPKNPIFFVTTYIWQNLVIIWNFTLISLRRLCCSETPTVYLCPPKGW